MRIKFAVIFLSTVVVFTSVECGRAQTNSFDYVRPFPSFKIAEPFLDTSSRVQDASSSRRRLPKSSRQSNSARPTTVETATADAQRIPIRGLPTTPDRALPRVDKTAFQTGSQFTTLPTVSSPGGYARNNAFEPSTFNAAKPKTQSVEPRVEGSEFVAEVRSPRAVNVEPIVGENPVWSNQSACVSGDCESSGMLHSQPERSFFGVSEDDCGDEWDGFAPCKQVNEYYFCGGYCCSDRNAKLGHRRRGAVDDQDFVESARRGHHKRCGK